MKKLLLAALAAVPAFAAVAQTPGVVEPTPVTAYTCTQQRMMVVEEGTGTWCGWCPGGIAGLAYMKENYGDYFIGIGVHASDVMAIPAYSGMFSSYPSCKVNRQSGLTTYPSITDLNNCYKNNFKDKLAQADVFVTAKWQTIERTGIEVTASAKFAQDYSNGKFRWAFVLLEHKVGPYAQNNNYSGGANGTCGGWENYPKTVSWLYEDVARYISNLNGDPNSVPTAITAGTEYTYTGVVPLMDQYNVKENLITIKPDDVEVVALLINTSTKQIVNAARVESKDIEKNTTLHYQSFTINNDLATCYHVGETLDLDVTASSGLPVSVEITSGNDLATLEGNTVTFTGIGSVELTFTQAGNDNYLAATKTVTLIVKKNQEITWTQDLSKCLVNESYPLEATASSGLDVNYKLKSYKSGVKVTNNGVIKFTKVNVTCVVVASQAGNDEYDAAENVEKEAKSVDADAIETITADTLEAGSLVFDLEGRNVARPETGKVYIVVTGSKARKVCFK